MTHTSKETCPDCGNAPVNHTFEKTSIALHFILDPINARMDAIWRLIEPIIGPFLYTVGFTWLLELFVWAHIGIRADDPDENTGGRAKCFWLEAKRRGISMWEFRLFGRGREVFVSEWKGHHRVFDGLPRPGWRTSSSILWMDNKGIMRKKFQKAGIPVANGAVSGTWYTTKSLFEKLEKPVIIKPNLGSRSRHTTTHIETLDELCIAYKKAKQLSPWVVLEEEHKGLVYRATVIGGKVIGVLRREPPCVYGDGKHTIKELIAIENKNPLRQGPVFHEIHLIEESASELSKQGKTLTTIPKQDEIVTLAQKASRGLGGGATDVTDETHSDNIKLFEYVAEVLNDSLVGIDFMIFDISKSWKEQKRCGVIECNSLPFIDLHLYPLRGEARDTPGALWNLIFPDSNPLVNDFQKK